MTGAVALQRLVALSSDSMEGAKRLARRFSKILFFSLADEAILPKRACALAIEAGELTAVAGSRLFSRVRARGQRRSSFEGHAYPTPQQVASACALAKDELKAFHAGMTLSIPKAWAIVRLVEFPATVREHLPDAVSYELDRLTPFTAESAIYDFRVLADKEQISLMLIAAKAEMVNPYLEALRDNGVRVDRVTVSPSAIATLCALGHPDTVFVNKGASGYDVGLVLRGTLAFLSAGTDLDGALGEVHRVTVGAAKQGSVPRLVLLGDQTELKERLPQALRATDGIDARLNLEGIPPSAAGAMLESLWPEAQGFNLLEKGRREREKKPWGVTAALLAALLALGVLYLIAPLRIEERRLGEIDRRVAAVRGEVRKVEALKKEVDALEREVTTIRDFKREKPMALRILRELTVGLPKSAWLTRVRVTETTVEIEGYAASATELLPKLEASPLLKKVEFASPTFRDVRLNSDRFVIKMEIEGLKEAKHD